MTLNETGDVAVTETTTELTRGTGVAAWRQIADAIAADIAAGRLAPGAQLPTEARLAERFAVNRHTARRALAALAAEGLVRTAQGKGSFVEARPLPYPIGPRTRFSENIVRAGHGAGGELIAARELPASAVVAERLGVEEGAAVLEVTSRRLADGVPITAGRSYHPLPRFAGFAEAYRATGSVTAALAACGVADYRRRSTAISARLATPEEAAALDLAPGRIVLVTEAVNVDEAGVPVQLTYGAFAADRVELRVEG